ncbi:MAG: outer membrane protein transport protein [Rhodospirillales bacterium]|nr:outer membrane protein transport protein [Rhodospirillales bacterium]
MRPTARIFTLGLLAASALAGLPRDVAATNGMNPICYGTDNCGMGGAGIAVGGNAAGAILNPALSGRAGRELLVSVGWLHADVSGRLGPSNHTPAGAGGPVVNTSGPQDSDASDFPDGSISLNWKFNDQWAVNFAAFPGGGGATDWPNRRTNANGGNTGSYDHQIRTRYFFFEPSVSYTPPQDKTWSFGLGAIISYQDMKTDSLGKNFGQISAANKQDTESAMGAGFHLGVFWQPEGLVRKDLLSIGATYRSHVWAETYEKYRSGGVQVFQGPMDMPPQWGVGMALKPIDNWTFAGDIKHIAWQSVKAIGGLQPADGGFGWSNQFVYAVGVAHNLTDWFTWRAGYNYGKSPIDGEHMFANFLFPAITEHHITAGASAKLGQRYEVGASAYWAPKVTIVNNPAGADSYAPTGGPDTKVEHEQIGAQISLKVKF